MTENQTVRDVIYLASCAVNERIPDNQQKEPGIYRLCRLLSFLLPAQSSASSSAVLSHVPRHSIRKVQSRGEGRERRLNAWQKQKSACLLPRGAGTFLTAAPSCSARKAFLHPGSVHVSAFPIDCVLPPYALRSGGRQPPDCQPPPFLCFPFIA